MKRIPVVLCFDDKLLMPAGVCINSLLMHAHENTFYHIFILHDSDCVFPQAGYLDLLSSVYPNCAIEYRCVGPEFKEAFQVRGITQATYYRLLIPDIVTGYDKLMYHDVDVIFRTDLSHVFEQTDLTDSYLAGVVAPSFMDLEMQSYIKGLGLNPVAYVLAGNIIMNVKKMRDDGVVHLFRKMVSESSYRYQDMDILNLVCRGSIKYLPPTFCGTIEMFKLKAHRVETAVYTQQDLDQLDVDGIVHYNGPKPWKEWCPNLDIWWEYYRKSPFYDSRYYFDFYMNKGREQDSMSFKNRLKLLVNYFYHRNR
ncbi:glycosyltransferase family 8 protein [Sphingobacterium sp. SYP-B4668]|uniref:glycosyltransferase family 8 protein n=1 Tax=Sphingobacterium sp. SYP-B4668 TaxID=2996035 RepID=UPI0022DD1471|nr:glycosyltransferase [Sphingobacterium sp. SYP-B4668]